MSLPKRASTDQYLNIESNQSEPNNDIFLNVSSSIKNASFAAANSVSDSESWDETISAMADMIEEKAEMIEKHQGKNNLFALTKPCKLMIKKQIKTLSIAFFLFFLFVFGRIFGFISKESQFWLMYMSTICICRICCQFFSFLVVKMIQRFTSNNWVIYYVDNLDDSLSPAFLSAYMLLSFRYNIDADFFYTDKDIDDDTTLLIMDRIIRCIAILFWSLLCKTIAIKYMAVKLFFKKYVIAFKSFF